MDGLVELPTICIPCKEGSQMIQSFFNECYRKHHYRTNYCHSPSKPQAFIKGVLIKGQLSALRLCFNHYVP